MAYLNKYHNQKELLLIIYCFVDDFVKNLLKTIDFAIQKPDNLNPPTKSFNLSISELISLFIYKHFTGHDNWKSFYNFILTYHSIDFPNLPSYQNFIAAKNKLSIFGLLMLNFFMKFFKKCTLKIDPKFIDSSKLEVCKIKRQFSHKICEGLARKSKSTMGWYYGFKLNIICNELMEILEVKITAATTDDRKAMEMMWSDILGMIIADAGYLGKNWQNLANSLEKQLLTAVRANMKKLMTKAQHELLKMRQRVESIFSILKLRFNMEKTLARSILGYFAQYIWCLVAYQLDRFILRLSNQNKLLNSKIA